MWDDRKKSWALAGAELIIFTLLILFGITGSSFGWLKNYPGVCDIMELTGERKIAGVYRGIRSDEFLHQGTPAALAQYHAGSEHFPRMNTRVGITPRDLAVYHDTGVPVRHFATLARPAVWGFFVFDLRRALSFYWFFPLFFALWGIHFLLNTLFPEQKFLNGLLSLSLIISPVCAAWSFWPAGNAGGLCWGAGSFLRLFKTQKAWQRVLWSFLAVWCALCSVMTLYMPRIFPVLCLLAVVVFSYLYEEKLFGKFKEFSLTLPLILFSLGGAAFCLAFVYDCREAVALLMDTAYPGKRRLSGGTMPLWTLVQGYLAPLTVYKVDYSNQCELTGPLTLVFPLILILKEFFKQQGKKILCVVLILFCFWVYTYQLIGFGKIFSMITLWNRCNPQRCDLALALAQIILCALLFSRMKHWTIRKPLLWAGISLGCCSLLLALAPAGLWIGLRSVYPPWYIMLTLTVIGIFAFALFYTLLSCSRAFIWIFCAGSMLPGLIFNPVNIAPLKIVNKLAGLEKEQKDSCTFLFLGEKNFCAVAAWAAGSKVFNGYFLYPDPAMLKLLFPFSGEKFNRISNYDMIVDHGACQNSKDPSAFYRVEDTSSDHIRFLLPCRSFDYSFFGVDCVAALHNERACLTQNPSLTLMKSGKELDFYRVKKPDSRKGQTEALFKKKSSQQQCRRKQ